MKPKVSRLALLAALVVALPTAPVIAAPRPPEVVRFERVTPYPIPYAEVATAFDPKRGTTLFFGGQTTSYQTSGETWELVEGNLVFRTDQGPSPRRRAAMAHDPVRGVTVLFGGTVAAGGSDETWEWDGERWIRVTTNVDLVGPLASMSPLMAYHPGRQVMVLIDGNGNTWERGSGPWLPRKLRGDNFGDGGAIVTASVGGKPEVMLFGATDAMTGATLGLMRWTGDDWVDVPTTGPSPAPRKRPPLVHDPERGRLVLVGGPFVEGDERTWFWDGTSWSKGDLLPEKAGSPLVAAWDGSRREVIALPGTRLEPLASYTLGDAGWALRPLSTKQPAGARGAAFALERSTGKIVLLTSEPASFTEGATWAFGEDLVWTKLDGPSPPPREVGTVVGLDGGGLLLFGGSPPYLSGSTAVYGDTWTWQDGTWKEWTGSPSPAPQQSACAAALPGGKALLLAVEGGPAAQSKTWLWDGGWTLANSSAEAPLPRAECAMARDPVSGKVLLFGGSGETGLLVDTWTWDGASWTKVPLDSSRRPPAALNRAMVADEARGRVYLESGDQLYLWGGESSGWVSQKIEPDPAFLLGTLAIDARGRLVRFGGGKDIIAMGLVSLGQPGGEGCTSAADCATGHCTDGVCCEQAECGECEACSLSGQLGVCSPRGVGERDPDTCQGALVCDGSGRCLEDMGAPCASSETCASGACIDGVCCQQSSCEGPCRSCALGQSPGKCGDVLGGSNPGRCDGTRSCDAQAICRSADEATCQSDADCLGGRCFQNACRSLPFSACEGDATAVRLGSSAALDVRIPCRSSRCVAGKCPESCKVTSECLPGYRCDADGRCVPQSDAPREVSGCSSGGRPAGSLAALAMTLAALAARSLRRGKQRALRAAGLASCALLVLLLGPVNAEAAPRFRAEVAQPILGTIIMASAAVDPVSKTVYLGGGQSRSSGDLPAPPQIQLFRWDGELASPVQADASPPALDSQSLVFDAKTGRLILTGGFGGPDTWSFDGQSWSRVASELNPLTLRGVAWAPALGGLLMVSTTNTLFALGPSGWELVPGSHEPALPSKPTVVYDENRERLVLFAGDLQSTFTNQLWEWDGTSWEQKTPSPHPGVLWSSGAYDPISKRSVFCGGFEAIGVPWTNVCQAWDGEVWADLPSPPGLPFGPALFFDPNRQRMLMLADLSNPALGTSGTRSLHELTPSGWKPVPAPLFEQPRFGMAAAYDPVRKVGVFFGGRSYYGGTKLLDATLTWDGKRLREVTTGTKPKARLEPEAAFDPVNQGVLMFGGQLQVTGNYARSGETWLFKDDTWTKVGSEGPGKPLPRSGTAMATDPVRNRVLMLHGGGVDDESLWIWDGQTWSEKRPLVRPAPARVAPVLAHDPGRDRFVFFGGASIYTLESLSDTWELDPTTDTWTRMKPAHAPEPRANAMLYYEPSLRKLVLLGGEQPAWAVVPPVVTAWAWDGEDWERLEDVDPLMARTAPGAYFDPDQGAYMAFGGLGLGAETNSLGLVAARVTGQACSRDEDCPTGHCTDGVCCQQAACGPCEACDVPGKQGACSLVPRGKPDDTCPEGACDGAGECLAFLGQPCATREECADGFCTDGVCCLEESCPGACRRCGREEDVQVGRGVCVAVTASEDEDTCSGSQVCDPQGDCKLRTGQPCSSADQCEARICAEGLCREESPPFCDGEHSLYAPGGQVIDCGAYRCTSQGSCRVSCGSNADCATGARCSNEGRCVEGAPRANDGGCSVAACPGHPGSAVALAALLGLCLARTRRRVSRAALAAALVGAAGCEQTPPLPALTTSGSAGGSSAGAGGQAGAQPVGGAAGQAGASGTPGAGGASSPRLSPDESLAACKAYWTRHCELLEACFPFQMSLEFRTKQACQTLAFARCDAAREANPDAALTPDDKACIDATSGATCDDFMRLLLGNEKTAMRCRITGEGALPLGSQCADGSQCASGRCLRGGSPGGCGTCVEPPGEGDLCVFGAPSECPSGLVCADDASCRKTAAAGEPCGLTRPCGHGQYCQGTCQPWKKLGEACSTQARSCEPGLACVGTCVPLELEFEEGKPCRLLDGGQRVVFCAVGLSCVRSSVTQASGICKKAPLEGEACNASIDASMPCGEPGLDCLDGICKPSLVPPTECL